MCFRFNQNYFTLAQKSTLIKSEAIKGSPETTVEICPRPDIKITWRTSKGRNGRCRRSQREISSPWGTGRSDWGVRCTRNQHELDCPLGSGQGGWSKECKWWDVDGTNNIASSSVTNFKILCNGAMGCQSKWYTRNLKLVPKDLSSSDTGRSLVSVTKSSLQFLFVWAQ